MNHPRSAFGRGHLAAPVHAWPGGASAQQKPELRAWAGGIWSEAIGDIALRAAPIGTSEAARAFGELRASALLDGARGAEPLDRQALARLLSQLSICLARPPWCRALDLNPVLASGSRFVIVDARMRVEGQHT